MVGSAIIRHISNDKNIEIITCNKNKLNLINQSEVDKFFANTKIDQVYLAAAKVGGIHANNTYPAEFIYENLMIEANVIQAAFKFGVKKLLFLGSSCIYPRFTNQPIKEKDLLTGTLESTNEPYAIAKIAGIKLCESYNRQYANSYGIDYRSVMPTNLYGLGDNYHPENSHVIPALIRRFHEAKLKRQPEVFVWGSGKPKREFLYVDDMAAACVHLMNLENVIYKQFTKEMCSHINVGVGNDISISELAVLIGEIVGFKGKISHDRSKPDGISRKLMDSSKLNKLGWFPKVSLKEGLYLTYMDFIKKGLY